MLYDAHVRLGNALYGYSLDLATLRDQMNQFQIARAILCPVRTTEYEFEKSNEFIASAVASDPESFVGFARVDPWLGDTAIRELDRAVNQLGLRGLLLDPWEDHYVISDPLVDPILDKASSLQIPVLVAGGYTNFSHPSQIAAMANRHQDLTFIATHGGQLNISGLLLADARAMLQAAGNVVIETSGVYREDFIEDTIEEFGAERVVFGSSAPVFDQGFETLRIRHAHLSDEVKQQIGRENIEQLLSHN